MCRLVLIFFLTMTLNYSWSQTRLEGNVVSTENLPISNASVVIRNSDNRITNYAFTNEEGNYTIILNYHGKILIEINKLGFEKIAKTITITKTQKNLQSKIVLQENSTLLEDIIIKIDNPVQVRGDTLEYDARAFSTGREQVVEDLLKNIPGISVEKDGTIKYEDKKIEKVMVDGDDLFNRGYSILTKNMPNKPLNKVQVLKRYSNNKLLKGIENSDKVAINLTIQEDYKDVWFGDISLGYGIVSENRYDVNGNLMNFSKNFKNFLSYNLNNVGDDRVGSLDDMFYNNSEIESVGQNAQLYNTMNINSGTASRLKDHRTRINNAEHVALSSIIPVVEKLKLKLTGFIGADENYSFNSLTEVVDVDETYFTNAEINSYKNHLKKGYLNLLATYDISAFQMLQISSVWNQGNNNVDNDMIFNGVSTLEKLQTKNTFTDQKVTFTHKWKEKNALLLKARYFSNKIPQLYNINDFLMDDLFSFDAKGMDNTIRNGKTFIGVEADFKLKQVNNSVIEFQIGYLNHQEDLNISFQLFNDNSRFYPENFQTRSSFTLGDIYAKSAYTWIRKSFKLNSSIDIHQLFNSFTTLKSTKKSQPFYINPTLNASFELSPTQIVTASYLVNFQSTSMEDVNDTYLLTSSRSFQKGLGEFHLTDFQMGTLRYSIRHYLNRYNFSINLNYRTQNKVLSSQRLIEQNSSLSQTIFIKGGETYSVNLSSTYSLKPLLSTIKVDVGYVNSTTFNEVNDSGLRKNDFYDISYKLSWKSNFRSDFNFLLGSEWSVSKVKSSNFENRFTNGFTFVDLYYDIGDRFKSKFVTEYYYFGNLPDNQKHHSFIDFEVTYRIIGDRYTVGIRGNNLLNKQNFTSFYVTDIGYSTTTYRLMPRYLIGSFKIRF